MALATVTSNTYGFRVTGGTDATPVTTYKTRVKTFTFVAAAGNDTCTITDKDGKAVIILTSTGTAGDILQVWFDEAQVDGITATLSNAAGVLLVILC
jgi:hypothetical protein